MTGAPAPLVAALVLAAGRSTRMAPSNKLLMQDASGLAMAARVAAACSASRAAWLIVVTGHQAGRVEQAVRQADIRAGTRFVQAVDQDGELSASLREGMAALAPEADGVLVCLADMPNIGPAMMDRLIAACVPECPTMPVWQGIRGNPVLWPKTYFAALAGLSGDYGGRQLLLRPGMTVQEVPADGPGVLSDCDTPEEAKAAGYESVAGE